MSSLVLHIDDGVASVELNRPARHNAFDSDMLTELDRALDRIESAADSLCATIIRGRGLSLSSGADLELLGSYTAAQARDFMLRAGWSFRRLERLPMPVIVIASGYCLGGGFELILHADLVIAVQGAELGFPEVGLGLVTTAGSAARLITAIGKPRAAELLLTGRRVGAPEAANIGLVSAVVPTEQLDDSLARWLAPLRAAPGSGVAAMKRLIRHAVDAQARTWIAELEQFDALVRAKKAAEDEGERA